jgi:putative addiction module component (TIGR02574 family)
MSLRAIEIEKLAPKERLELISALWESLRDTPQRVPVTDAQRDELDRRLDDVEAGGVETLSWDDVTERLRRHPA